MKHKSSIPTASLGFGIANGIAGIGSDQGVETARKVKILIVDHDAALCRQIARRLAPDKYHVDSVAGGQVALDACIRSRPNLVIAELRMEDMDGLAFLKELKSRWPQIAVIVLTAHGTIAEAVQATQIGAFGYLVKPVEKEELIGQVERATAESSFALTDGDWRASFASRSQLMQDRLGLANRAAASDEPALLTGENGTGKELLARAIHAASVRRTQSFVVVSCRQRDEEELRAELFGADFDGARDAAAGAFSRARGGSLLLEEIGELSARLQAMLARLLSPDPTAGLAGTNRPAVRLICTTSADLKSLTDTGGFLPGLYYLINILPIEIPPLGRRREDIPLLVSHFLEQATEPGEEKKIYSAKAIELLATTDWPGNVRQLFELVKQNVALSHGRIMTKEFVQKFLDAEQAKIPTYDEARESFSRDYLVKNMQQTAGNVAQSARLAKRNRTDFYNLLARYRLHPEDFKNPDRGGGNKENEGEDQGGAG